MTRRHPALGLVLMVLMSAAAVAAYALKPTQLQAKLKPPLDLETVIPRKFGDWRVDDISSIVLPSPETQAALDKIYTQTVARTYINNRGQRIMLSIAYGANQSDALEVHMPEGCYAGQGFAIKERSQEVLQTAFSELPVTRLVAEKGARNEPITYWIVIGEKIARNQWEMKRIKLGYASRGLIPEALLFRVSNITPNNREGYATQQQFIEAVLSAIPHETRNRLFSNPD